MRTSNNTMHHHISFSQGWKRARLEDLISLLIPLSFACKGIEAMGVSVVARDERSEVSVEWESVALSRSLS
ncbi:MAG: hypothetical protein IKW83_00440 [Muribaculaceae bacterium]|nr:hypothetical protein [Muribaculaceae bacterium]